ncbi:hypothetical protein ELI38_15480 [Rhizobium leguminosarum]|uniref:hypothetical protein n=1 Tax=Rhizobium leguminosarum TaxID=384 RepID=UPI00103017D9|nr:hypothetical protein [Rhizobium leguminosarum]TAU97273.1 hypothetical protein ELI38_15480 [Rhizobium leguminosarum]
MYLWKRENGFTFQQRIPISFESQFGKSPIRVNLGPLSAASARKRAIILSGAAMQLMDDAQMTRETLIHSLRALNDELQTLSKRHYPLGLRATMARQEAKELEADGDHDAARYFREKAIKLAGEKASVEDFKQRLQTIVDALSKDSIAWEAERNTFETVVRTLGSMGAQAQSPQPIQQVEPIQLQSLEHRDERAVTPATKLSVAGRIVLKSRRDALDTGEVKKASRYEERLESTLQAFLDIVGDHSISYYLPLHLQDFATALGQVPANRSKFPIFKGLSLKQVVEKNERLPKGERYRHLAETTIKSHVHEIKMIWSKATASVKDAANFDNYNVTMPKAASASIDREALPAASINKWLADAARPELMKKPHKAWLPLLGYLTGMRLSEIVFLQSKDLVIIDGNEVFDLRLPLIIGGEKVPRPLKTKTSVRIVALHPLLRECGFIDFMKRQRGRDGFVFPRYHSAEDPADAAQKQQGNWMKALGIHVTQRQVFHSLRHNAKSWFRIHAGDTVADRQCGHAAKTVGAAYGFKSLEPEEVEKLMAMPHPRNIDFTPFINLCADR